MIKNKADYKRYIKTEDEIYHTSYPNFSYELKKILKFIKLYRKVEYYHNCRQDILGKIYYKYLNYKFKRLSIKYSIFLPINTIDEGLCIIHIGPIYINSNAKIGKYLKIHPMTTIGKNIGINNHSPILGDHIWIGPGARIIGNITIGNNVIIGTNSVVNKSFKSNQVIAGIPAKTISNKSYNDYFKRTSE